MSISFDIGLKERLQPVVTDLRLFIESLRRPPKFLFIRVNTLKVTVNEYKNLLKKISISFVEDPDLPEALGFEIEGPNLIDKKEKVVIADKRASESVMLGSDLFAPGVKSARGVRRGDKVTILAPNGIPIAEGVALMDEGEIFTKKRGLAVRTTRSIYSTVKVSELPGVSEGLFYAQSLPSMVAVKMLDPRPGEVILDLTAAPGGKISYVAQLAGPSSKLLAVDRRSKINKLKVNLEKLGASWVKVMAGDSRKIDSLLPELKGKVDKVIVDPPCSNLGVRPKILERRTLKEVIDLTLYQRSFLKAARVMLRKGGRVLYSTCTITWEENEMNVEYAEELGFHVVEPPEWVKRRWDVSKKGVRFCPVKHNLPGFFATILEL